MNNILLLEIFYAALLSLFLVFLVKYIKMNITLRDYNSFSLVRIPYYSALKLVSEMLGNLDQSRKEVVDSLSRGIEFLSVFVSVLACFVLYEYSVVSLKLSFVIFLVIRVISFICIYKYITLNKLIVDKSNLFNFFQKNLLMIFLLSSVLILTPSHSIITFYLGALLLFLIEINFLKCIESFSMKQRLTSIIEVMSISFISSFVLFIGNFMSLPMVTDVFTQKTILLFMGVAFYTFLKQKKMSQGIYLLDQSESRLWIKLSALIVFLRCLI